MITASQHLNGGLTRFAAAREGARKFHRAEVGDVDPERCLGDWLLRVAKNDEAGIEKRYGGPARSTPNMDLGYREKAAMTTGGDGTTGGYLVPQQLLDDLLADIAEEAIVRPRATVVPMKSATLLLPLPDATTAAGVVGTSDIFGGMQMSWTQEAATRAETEPKFRLVELHAWELSGYLYLSNPIADDGLGLDSWLRKLIARSVGHYEDYAFFQGTGVGQPVGMITSAAAAGPTRSGGNLIAFADINGLLKSLLPSSFARAVWAFSPTTLPQTMQLADGTNRATTLVTAAEPADDLERHQWQLTGFPAYCTETLPALGTAGDLLLFDPRLYVLGDRRATEISVSKYEPTGWKNNQQAWKCVHRVDGQPWLSKKVTLMDNTTTVSPYVYLH